MLFARLILLVLATTLICDDSLGVEPNDRIDQVLAVMVKMNEKVDVLTGKMNSMEETVADVKKQVEKVDNDVLYNTWKFVGSGFYASHDDQVQKSVYTMKECLEFCQSKRMSDGGEWNGVVWNERNGNCWCEKNDRGHREHSDYQHFRAQ